MRHGRTVVGLLALAMTSTVVVGAVARAADPDERGLRHLGQIPITIAGAALADGSDMAFQGNTLVAGSYQGIGLFTLQSRAPFIRQRSFFTCPGGQGDVSVWNDLVVMSREETSNEGFPDAPCNAGSTASQTGIRLIDISNPDRPEQVGLVPIPCGSHTHTIVPDGKDLLVYVSSMESVTVVSNPGNNPCNRDGSAGFSIVRVPIADPSKARVVGEYNALNGDGCHDITVFTKRDLAFAACAFSDTQILDISDPANPVKLASIVNPAMQIHHTSSVTWDGKYLALGDERLLSTTGCMGGRAGAIWFYDITDPTKPVESGFFELPRTSPPTDTATLEQCWSHNFNVVPMRDPDRYVLVAGYYTGGLTVVDFSDPSAPRELAFDDPEGNDMWGAYFFDGRIYTMDWLSGRGVGVYEHPELGRDDTFSLGPRVNPQLQISPRRKP